MNKIIYLLCVMCVHGGSTQSSQVREYDIYDLSKCKTQLINESEFRLLDSNNKNIWPDCSDSLKQKYIESLRFFNKTEERIVGSENYLSNRCIARTSTGAPIYENSGTIFNARIVRQVNITIDLFQYALEEDEDGKIIARKRFDRESLINEDNVELPSEAVKQLQNLLFLNSALKKEAEDREIKELIKAREMIAMQAVGKELAFKGVNLATNAVLKKSLEKIFEKYLPNQDENFNNSQTNNKSKADKYEEFKTEYRAAFEPYEYREELLNKLTGIFWQAIQGCASNMLKEGVKGYSSNVRAQASFLNDDKKSEWSEGVSTRGAFKSFINGVKEGFNDYSDTNTQQRKMLAQAYTEQQRKMDDLVNPDKLCQRVECERNQRIASSLPDFSQINLNQTINMQDFAPSARSNVFDMQGFNNSYNSFGKW